MWQSGGGVCVQSLNAVQADHIGNMLVYRGGRVTQERSEFES